MRLLNCSIENFGSYKNFTIDFSAQDLALLYGKTGSGKSTIPDAPCWILYGQTAKDGSADDVRSWTADGAPTKGTQEVELKDGTIIIVTRIRGKASQNDLFWSESNDPSGKIRGKDLNDTQRLLEARMGVPSELYIAASYFHEFSPTGGFFTATAKARRSVFERLASMATAIELAEKSVLAKKELKVRIASLQTQHDRLDGSFSHIISSIQANQKEAKYWQKDHEDTLLLFNSKSSKFEEEKEKDIQSYQEKHNSWQTNQDALIDRLLDESEALNKTIVLKTHYDAEIAHTQEMIMGARSQQCPTCKGYKPGKDLDSLQDRLTKLRDLKVDNSYKLDKFTVLFETVKTAQVAQSPYLGQLQQAESRENTYSNQIDIESKKVNPFKAQIEKLTSDLKITEDKLAEVKEDIACSNHRYKSLDTLQDLSGALRGALLTKAVREVEAATNNTLESHFDAALRVTFNIQGADSLDVGITKDGHDCAYKQLSKGQRQLLKLAFVTSVMTAAANQAGDHFSTLFFDEALDGLDVELKVKAFSLFEELQSKHESIFLIDHAQEFQNLFSNKYHVTMQNDESHVSHG